MCIFISVCAVFYSLLAAFETARTNEETKNTWARDDPAILILMAGGMFGESSVFLLPYSITFRYLTRL
jgi:hypothetical protein